MTALTDLKNGLPKLAKKDCSICNGTGQYRFMGSFIFCTTCLGEERVGLIWTFIAQHVKSHVPMIRGMRR